jgi:hypothetical protein
VFTEQLLQKKTKNTETKKRREKILRLAKGTQAAYDFTRLLLLRAQREASALANELPEESDQFRFLHVDCLDNPKGSVGLILG